MIFLEECWSTTAELAPWLFLGALVSALLHRFLPQNFISQQLKGYAGILRSVLIGVPLPLCSCGVIPAGIGLKKDGAADSAAISFLISTPQTGVDSVLVSAAFLGWPFAIFKVISAGITGVIGGLLVEKHGGPPTPIEGVTSQNQEEIRNWSSAWSHGVQLLRSIWKWLLIGILLSAALSAFLPQETFASLDNGPFAIIAALLISVPLYVCATASVPIAAALVNGGFPLGAALVFLMAGPATNVATIGAIFKSFGKRVTFLYLATVIISSVALGMGFDFVLESAPQSDGQPHDHGSWWQIPFATALVFSMFYFFYEEQKRKWKANSIPQNSSLEIGVDGMTCGGVCCQIGAYSKKP